MAEFFRLFVADYRMTWIFTFAKFWCNFGFCQCCSIQYWHVFMGIKRLLASQIAKLDDSVSLFSDVRFDTHFVRNVNTTKNGETTRKKTDNEYREKKGKAREKTAQINLSSLNRCYEEISKKSAASHHHNYGPHINCVQNLLEHGNFSSVNDKTLRKRIVASLLSGSFFFIAVCGVFYGVCVSFRLDYNSFLSFDWNDFERKAFSFEIVVGWVFWFSYFCSQFQPNFVPNLLFYAVHLKPFSINVYLKLSPTDWTTWNATYLHEILCHRAICDRSTSKFHQLHSKWRTQPNDKNKNIFNSIHTTKWKIGLCK